MLSPDGERLLAVRPAPRAGGPLVAFAWVRHGGHGRLADRMPAGFSTVAGFLPDGERFVTVEDVVRIRSFATE